MKRIILTAIFILLQKMVVIGQTGPIVVQYGNNISTYANLNTAITQAPSSATIYLPGGNVPYIGTYIIINKPLSIIGAGIYPDSTNTTNFSNLGNLTIILDNGSDNSKFEGFAISKIRTIHNQNYSLILSNIVFNRIRFYRDIVLTVANQNGELNDFLIYNCILDSGLYYLERTNNLTISNNIIAYNFPNLLNNPNNNVRIFNNLFLGNVPQNSPYPLRLNNSNVKNNIFTGNVNIDCYSSNIKNNYSNGSVTFMDNYSSSLSNYLNTPPQNVLTSYTPPFSFSNDYHVINGSVGDNGGDDGTDIGIYGGLYPWKDGLVPQNPHIRDAIVSPQSNSQGEINIHFKVGAQEH